MNLLNSGNKDNSKVEDIKRDITPTREVLTTESAVMEKLKEERRKIDKERYAQRSSDWKKIKKELDTFSYGDLIGFIDTCDPHENAIATMTFRVSPYEFALIKAASLKANKPMRDILVNECTKIVFDED